MYSIIAIYQGGSPEEIDTAETEANAYYLMREYQSAFGNEWSINIKRNQQ
jgi:hypothetical protein